MDETYGELTTGKLQALVDAAYEPGVHSRRDIAAALTAAGEKISIHGVEAWFRHVDSNYNLKRPSLDEREPSYRIPKRRWRMILELFALAPEDLDRTDREFRTWCFDQARQRKRIAPERPMDDASGTPGGREIPWRRMAKALQRANEGSPTLVLLNGPEGIGKSHLLREFANHLRNHGVLVFNTACAAHTGLPLIPIVEMFRSDRGALLAAGERFEQQFQEIFEQYADRNVDGFESPRTFLEVMALLTGLARQHTVTLCIDDLHLADDATASFLDYLGSQMRARADFKLLVIGAYRPGGGTTGAQRLISALEPMSGTIVERLEALSADGLKGLLDEHLEIPLSSGALNQVWRFSQGRLGSALELVNLLTHRQMLSRRNGELHLASDFDAADLPADLTGIPLDALQRLSPEARELLTLAAAIGTSFNLEILQKLRPKWSLQTILTAVEEAEALEILAHERDQFRFCHAALARNLYDGMSDTRRARAHLEIATRQQEPRTDLQQITLAHHLRRAGPLVGSLELLDACLHAAWAAARLAAWPQVIEFAQAALEIDATPGPSLTQQGSLLRLLASAWHQTGNPDAAIHCLRDALERFRAAPDELETSRTLHDLVRIRGNFARLQPPDRDPDLDELIQRSHELARQDPRLASRAYDAIASRMMYLGDRDRALAFARQARAVVEHDEPSTEKALACIAVALGHLRHLELGAATANLEDALYIALEIGDQHTAARALQRLTMPYLARGRLDQVDSLYHRVVSMEHPLVRTGEMSIPMASRVAVLALRGEFRLADTVFDEARTLIRETGYFWSEVNLHAAQLFALVAQGNHAQACALLDALENDHARGTRQGATILRRYRQLIETLAAPSRVRGGEVVRADAAQPVRAGDQDLNALAKYCLNLEEGLCRNHKPAIQAGFETLRIAYARGARFSLGWPFCIPHLMARAAMQLGELQMAQYYLISAHQLCVDSGARVEGEAILTTAEGEFPELAGALRAAPSGADPASESPAPPSERDPSVVIRT